MIAARPRVLIVDDDPVSLAFLQAAVERCGCEAIGAANAAIALARLEVDGVELLLIDRRMPGIDGAALLRAARARGIQAPAIATSAEFDRTTTAALHAAGFADTLLKPANLATIHQLLRRFVTSGVTIPDEGSAGIASTGSMALLDDAAALAAIGGDHMVLRALRVLFARELDDAATEPYSDNTAQRCAMIERLHRMRASCSICGASALGEVALQFQRALRNDSDDAASAQSAFLQMCAATKQALAAN